MHRSESENLTSCAVCGAEISVGRDRAYAISGTAALCFACAMRRGGSYDEREDRWRTPPDLRGLATSEE